MQCRILSQSSGAVLASCPSCVDWSRYELVQVFPHLNRSSCSISLFWRPNVCRQWIVPNWTRRRVRLSCHSQAKDIPLEVDITSKTDDGDDIVGYPSWVEEDDPTWPEDDPDGEGYGFRISDFFEPKIKNDPNDKKDNRSPEDDELDLSWELEQEQWVVREITSLDWNDVLMDDPTPLIFFAFERYGPSGSECWQVLEALEKVVRTILDTRKYPIRAVKLDISMEPDVGAALKIKKLPTLLFINGAKPKFQISGVRTSDEILAIASHIFYHSGRPACMDEVDASHKVASLSRSD